MQKVGVDDRHPGEAPARRSSCPASPRPTSARSRWRAAPASSSTSRSSRGSAVTRRRDRSPSSPTRAAQAAVEQAQALLDQRMAEYEANKRLIDQGDAPQQPPAGARGRGRRGARGARRGAGRGRQVDDQVADRRHRRHGAGPGRPGGAGRHRDRRDRRSRPDAGGRRGQRGAARQPRDRPDRRRCASSTAARSTGTVSFVGLSADKATRTYPVEARMANPDAAIADGVTCEMAVTLDADRGGGGAALGAGLLRRRPDSACASPTPTARRSSCR